MQLNVIYLDDEPDLCEIFVDEFSTDHILIKTFTDPTLAIAEAEKVIPDLVFLDYRLPATNGDRVAQLMKLEIPKYLITGENAVRTEYPFIQIIKKPLNREIVRNILTNFLSKKGN